MAVFDKSTALDSFCAAYDFKGVIEGNPKPVSQEEFLQLKIDEYVRSVIINYETSVAQQEVKSQKRAEIDAADVKAADLAK